MANPYFQAKVLWESGQRQEGLAILNDFLENEIAQPVFRPHSRIFHEKTFESWDRAFVSLFCNSDALVAPFARVFPSIWQILPSQHTIIMLMNQDFARQPEIPDYLAEIEGLEGFDYQHTYHDFVHIAETLAESARKGILRPHSDEYRGTGVAHLSLDQIREASQGSWSSLGSLLLSYLPEAYAACPPDFWKQQATEEPDDMVARMLHMAFGEGKPMLQTSRMNLERIALLAPEYCNALLIAINHLISSGDIENVANMVRYDANIPNIKNPYLWLQLLYSDLKECNFNRLIQETAKYRL